MQRHRTTPRNRTALVAIVALGIVAACGAGDDDHSGVASLNDEPAGTNAETSAGTDGDIDGDTDNQILDPEGAVLAFAQCMREHGVDMADPQVSEGGGIAFEFTDDGSAPALGVDEMDAAFDECGELIERSAFDGREHFDESEYRDQMLEFTQCMRGEGVELDDPDFSDTGEFEHESLAESDGPVTIIAGPFGVLDLGDPDVAAALETCGDTMGFGMAHPIDGGEIVEDIG